MWFPHKNVVHAMLIYARGRLDSKTEAVELVQDSRGVDDRNFLESLCNRTCRNADLKSSFVNFFSLAQFHL